MSLRRLLAPATLAVALLTGCGTGIQHEERSQRDVIGDAQLTQRVCANLGGGNTQGVGDEQTPPQDCMSLFPQGPPPMAFPAGAGIRYLLAYLVRDGVVAPGTLPASGLKQVILGASGDSTQDVTEQSLTYVPSASYTAQLQTNRPAPAGMHWTGYISNLILLPGTPSISQSVDGWTVAPRFSLPQPVDGPFRGPVRIPFGPPGATSPDDPVTCADLGASALLRQELVDRLLRAARLALTSGNSVCARDDDRAPVTSAPVSPGASLRQASTPLSRLPPLRELATRDLHLTGSAGPQITQGQSGTVTFTAAFAGAAGDVARFALTPTGDLPVGAFAAAPQPFAPATDSTTPLTVSVAVPSDARVGEHTMTLTASVGGQQRSAKATFTVLPKPVTVVAPVTPARRPVR